MTRVTFVTRVTMFKTLWFGVKRSDMCNIVTILSYSVCMNGLNLSRVFVTKFLGVHNFMDSKLDWNYHIEIVRNKVAKNVSVMNRVKHVLTSSALYSLYCTFVMPYLTYCCEVWGNNYKTRIQSLFILQKELLEFV